MDKLLRLVWFSLYSNLFWEIKKTETGILKDLQFCPESLGAMLEFCCIERGLLEKRDWSWWDIFPAQSEGVEETRPGSGVGLFKDFKGHAR